MIHRSIARSLFIASVCENAC